MLLEVVGIFSSNDSWLFLSFFPLVSDSMFSFATSFWFGPSILESCLLGPASAFETFAYMETV